MAVPFFYSVERQGYTTVSSLMRDVYVDMKNNGFTLINLSNDGKTTANTAPSDYTGNLTSFTARVEASGDTSHALGTKLYIQEGTRPSFAGVERDPPYVLVTRVKNNANNQPRVSEVSQVICDYDYPIWNDEPNGFITTTTDKQGNTPSGVIISLTKGNKPDYFTFTMEASGSVDPLNSILLPEAERQPWRLQFRIVDPQKVAASVATPLQMYYDEELGRVKISTITDDTGAIVDNVGSTGAVQPAGVFSDTDINQGLYNRKVRVANNPETFPLSYLLTITDRGFFLGIWEGSWSTTRAQNTATSNYFNWVLVQRPVDRNTGVTLTRGKCPVFHVNGVNYKYYKSVVRESDVLHPTSGPAPSYRVFADSHSEDSHMILNSSNQVALTEDKTYLLSFPHNLTTPRFRYTEELDIIGATSSDVVMSGQDIQFTTYGEWGPRTYRAMPPSRAFNTGLRIAVLHAPTGPRWQTGNDQAATVKFLGEVTPGTIINNYQLVALPLPDRNNNPVYSLVRGSLPAGLAWTTDGIITGTVTAADYSEPTDIKFTMKAKNFEDTGYALRDFYYRYLPPSNTGPEAPELTTAEPNLTFTAGQAVTPVIPVTVSGGEPPLTYVVNPALPTGLDFNTANAEITGTPTSVSTQTLYTVTVTDNQSRTDTAGFTITVEAAAPVPPSLTLLISNPVTYQINVNVEPTNTVALADGTAPFNYTIDPPLPAGLTLNATNGQLSGTPTELWNQVHTITVTDGNSLQDSVTFTLEVV